MRKLLLTAATALHRQRQQHARGFCRPRRALLMARLLGILSIYCLLPTAYCLLTHAQASRVVIIKVDGLPEAEVDRFVRERDPRTGKSMLPWIEHVFYQNGTRVENFYVRGMSLSGPSWSLLDTGQHLHIKGNVEFDRFTLHTYDYLNFIPFAVENVGRRRIDMPGTELLDELGVPLFADNYANDERYLSFQTYVRGLRWTTLEYALRNYFTTRAPDELLAEWTMGVGGRGMVLEQTERELLARLANPRLRYLDLYTAEFDHHAHHNRDRATHLAALQELDAQIGRVWTAIEQSKLAADTAFVVVSDHGINSDERYYSQGFNLVKLLGSAAGGGHHIVTKRRLLNDYSLKSIYPLIPLITTTTPDSYYLQGQSTDYPTALLDFDGNERAGLHLRESDLNLLHILLLELKRPDLAPDLRRAATDAFFTTLERRRPEWQRTLDELREELGALHKLIERQAALVAALPKKLTPEELAAGRDKDAIRQLGRLDSWRSDERDYTEYARTLANLLALKRDGFDPARLVIPDVIAKGAMGERNSVFELQNYVVGLAPTGLRLAADGSLDMQASFKRLDYPALLRAVSVRNNVQPDVDNHPVDFVATSLPADALRAAVDDPDLRADDYIWLYRSEDSQALLLARRGRNQQISLRFVPIAHLRQDADGTFHFERQQWRAELPLQIWEDARLQLPAGAPRAAWLSAWHTDLEWLRAVHETTYSNGVIGLHEEFAHFDTPATEPDAPGLARDEQLLHRFRRRQRALIETDLFIHASNHWNFDVRGFNPGGNHGSFYRVSTHATLMFAGGENTNIPRGLAIREPYDSLSFVPTVLTLTGQLPAPGMPLAARYAHEAAQYPGRIITELFTTGAQPASAPVGGREAPR